VEGGILPPGFVVEAGFSKPLSPGEMLAATSRIEADGFTCVNVSKET